MPGLLVGSLSPSEMLTLGLLILLVILIVIMAVQTWRNSRVSPEEAERRRRKALVSKGKMGDANLLDIHGHWIYYSYDVRGVEYTATQDISTLGDVPPGMLSSAVGPVYVKYDPRNPANSIILAEDWSGLRINYPQN